MENTLQPLPEAVVVTTDTAAFARRRRTQLIFLIGALVAAAVLAVLPIAPVGKIVIGAAVVVGDLILYFGQMSREQRAVAVDRPLILDASGFELVDRGERYRFAWSQLHDLVPQQQGGIWFNRWWDLVFVLTPEAQATVKGTPTTADRLLTWNAGRLAFRHPAPSPSIEEIAGHVARYWSAANGVDMAAPPPGPPAGAA